MQVVGLLTEVEGQDFEKRVSTYLPLLTNILALYDPNISENEPKTTTKQSPELDSVKESVIDESTDSILETEAMEDDKSADKEKTVEDSSLPDKEMVPPSECVGGAALDHLLFTALTTVRKLCVQCSLWRGRKWAGHMTQLWGEWYLE